MEKKEFKPKKLSMTNTKKELLDSYNEMVKRLQEIEQVQLNPQKIVEEKRKIEVIEKVKGFSVDTIEKAIDVLKNENIKLLDDLKIRLSKEVEKFDNIQQAIVEKEKELKEIFEIEKSAYSLAALIETQNRKKEEFETEMDEKKNTLLKEIEETRAAWQKEKTEKENELAEWQKIEEKRRKREKEEYEYSFNREKQLAKDKLEDELNKREKEVTEKLENLRIDLEKREEEVKVKEKEYAELKSRIEKIDEELEIAVDKAIKDTTERLQIEFKNKEDLLNKEFEGEKNVLTTKIQSLDKLVADQEKKIAQLSSKLDQAYQKVQEVAIKAIDGTSNLKSFNELQKILTEKVANKEKG